MTHTCTNCGNDTEAKYSRTDVWKSIVILGVEFSIGRRTRDRVCKPCFEADQREFTTRHLVDGDPEAYVNDYLNEKVEGDAGAD